MSDDELNLQQPDIPLHQATSILKNGTVDSEHGLMRWGSNYTFLVSVTHAETTVLAIYKPRMGERPLWDFPDGTLCQREVAAFVLSDALHWQIVPPTFLRQGPRDIGSIQLFIDHDPEIHYFTFDIDVKAQLRKMALFDYLINNADRKGGHCLLDPKNHLWGIDHGLTFHSSPKLRTVIWDFAGQSIPRHLLNDVEHLCTKLEDPETKLSQQLCELLSDREMRALRNRLQHILKTQKFPLPGSGPNRPLAPRLDFVNFPMEIIVK